MDQTVSPLKGTRKKEQRHVTTINRIREDHAIELDFIDVVDDTCHVPRRETFPSPLIRRHSDFAKGCAENVTLSTCESAQSNDQILSGIESLPKLYRRSNRRIGRLNTQLLEAVESGNVLEVKRLLEVGANPNATCHVDFVSACHIAALTGGDALPLLLEYGAENKRTDRMGRTPLHLAAWAGHVRHLGLFLKLPEELQRKLDHGEVTPEVESEVRKLRPYLKIVVNTRCELGEMSITVPKEWRDGLDHNCSNVANRLPFFQPGWTPLHAASCSAQHHCVRLLLAAGAEPCLRDVISRTPFDVAGSSYYGTLNKQPTLPAVNPQGFAEVIAMLLATDCRSRVSRKHVYLHTPLHTAVELQSLESISLLLQAGACPANLNREGLTPLHMCVKKQLKQHLKIFIFFDYHNSQSPSRQIVDVKDKDGYSVLHFSVLSNWLPGVSLALEAGANVFSRSYDGQTPLHSAAELGHLDILEEILSFAKDENAIDKPNKNGETALLKAVIKGNIECVKMLLKEGASIEITLPNKEKNVFHIAAERGCYDMLKFLLDYNYNVTRVMINHVTSEDRRGYGPIHFAVERNHIECVKLLLSQNAFINLKATNGIYKGSTPLHIAARKNNVEIVKLILKNNNSAIYAQDSLGWNALHTACYYASRDVIKLLLQEGSDISASTGGEANNRTTAIQMLMNNLSKPTEFIHEIFDSCIQCNNTCPQDPSCKVTVDYGILVPNKHINSGGINDIEMKVLEALLSTGNTYDQKRLLIHPLVESFLCLKWKALIPFFYTMLVLYGLFVVTLSVFILSVYYYRDSYNSSNTSTESPISNTNYSDAARPEWLNYRIWAYVLYFTIILIVAQEILYMNVSKRYFLQLETWVKFSSIALAILLPQAIYNTDQDWPRHLATIALLLSWLQMTFLLSRFPKWGYYVLMFRKVSSKVLKILLTFVFLVIGFALSFMLEYRSKIPFENPWDAFVKTMVMMTSEFDYDDLVDKKDSLNTSMFIIRLLFFIFLILAAIVLMNLMVAVAVNDLNDLEVCGNIMRLEKQVEFLASLETLVNNKMVMKLLPTKLKYKLRYARSLSKIDLRPCEPLWSYSKNIPAHVRDAIIDKAQSKKEKNDDKVDCEKLQMKIDQLLDAVRKADKKTGNQRFMLKNVSQRISNDNALKHEFDSIKKQINLIDLKLETLLRLKQNDY